MKLYADEQGAAPVRRLDDLVVARIARVEVPAALWRKERLGDLEAAEVTVLLDDFAADWAGLPGPRFTVVADTDRVLVEAAQAAGTHGLRAYDALQLASATAARRADPSLITFACFDRALRRAAAASGFALLP